MKHKLLKVLMCLPLEYCPEHPIDQSDCIIEACPKCKTPMWVSVKKRIIRQADKSYQIMCGYCLGKYLQKNKIDNLTTIDLAKL